MSSIVLLVGMLWLLLDSNRVPVAAELAADEEVWLFPTLASRVPGPGDRPAQWSVPVHAWVFEPERDSLWRRGSLRALRGALGLDRGSEKSALFREVAYRGRPASVTVILDLDDTLKVSNLNDHTELLCNTFSREFRVVSGFPEVCRRWERRGAQFVYLSASPWQLYAPIHRFLEDAGFPGGAIHLKSFRLKDERFLALFRSTARCFGAIPTGSRRS